MIRYGARMRTLVVGGGIAGLTLAALMRQRGASEIDVIEKASRYGGVGYVLGLWPAGGNVAKELGVFEELLEHSIPATPYTAFDASDNQMLTVDFSRFDRRTEDARLIERSDLLEVLHEAVGIPVRFTTSIEHLHQDADGVDVTFDDGRTERYDCVIGADGVHSQVRTLAFEPAQLRYGGMSGWAFWTTPEFEGIREYFGNGSFAGFYPARDVLCCFAVMAARAGAAQEASTIAEVRERFHMLPKSALELFDRADPAQRLWRDDFYDVRAERWSNGRIALVGDAAAAFLPTAGVGASMAMESAAVLADELSRADSRFVAGAFERYERRRRKRVVSIQSQSRALTWLIRVRGPLANARNAFLSRTSPRAFVGSFGSVLTTSVSS